MPMTIVSSRCTATMRRSTNPMRFLKQQQQQRQQLQRRGQQQEQQKQQQQILQQRCYHVGVEIRSASRIVKEPSLSWLSSTKTQMHAVSRTCTGTRTFSTRSSTYHTDFYCPVSHHRHHHRHHRCFSSSSFPSGPYTLDMDALTWKLQTLAPDIASSLLEHGYYVNDNDSNSNSATEPLLDMETIQTLRLQAMALRGCDGDGDGVSDSNGLHHDQITIHTDPTSGERQGRYEPSWSESIDSVTGQVTRFDKPGVYACEPDGADYDMAPDIISYMSVIITTLPTALNPYLILDQKNERNDNMTQPPEEHRRMARISNAAFNAKLAVTTRNSEYPLHVDNSLGLAGGDVRKLTCILYLNPNYSRETDEGVLELHALAPSSNDDDSTTTKTVHVPKTKTVVVEPSTTFCCFWTDEIPHKVLRTGVHASDRYALTIWLADEEPLNHIHSPHSKFASLRHAVEFSRSELL